MKALITGISGQDGSYLAEFLLFKGYEVHGLVRRKSDVGYPKLEHLFRDIHSSDLRLFLHYGDITDSQRVAQLIKDVQPDEIYNLAAQSHVKVSFKEPNYTSQVGFLGTLNILSSALTHCPDTRIYQASSSEMFGSTPPPQSESSTLAPNSPYAVAKTAAHHLANVYRSAYGLRISCGILFNHESPRRGANFLPRKVSMGVAKIALGLETKLYLGNLKAKRDWGYAPEYIVAMWKMLQEDVLEDYVVSTGKSVSVEDYVRVSFERFDLNWRDYVEIDERYLREKEVEHLQGDSSKILASLGWKAHSDFSDISRVLTQHDFETLEVAKGEVDVVNWRKIEEQVLG